MVAMVSGDGLEGVPAGVGRSVLGLFQRQMKGGLAFLVVVQEGFGWWRLSIWMELPVSEMAADRVFESESVS